MNQLATDFLKASFYSGQITGDELMRRVEAEVRREVAAEIEQIRGERDETAKELSEVKDLVSERESRLAHIKLLLEPIYGSTNYAPIGSVLARVMDACDREPLACSFPLCGCTAGCGWPGEAERKQRAELQNPIR
jgi:hypothetical protein